jgi:hypothetical protein
MALRKIYVKEINMPTDSSPYKGEGRVGDLK